MVTAHGGPHGPVTYRGNRSTAIRGDPGTGECSSLLPSSYSVKVSLVTSVFAALGVAVLLGSPPRCLACWERRDQHLNSRTIVQPS